MQAASNTTSPTTIARVPMSNRARPSVTGFAGGRPKVEEIVAYWPALIDKTQVRTAVEIIA